MEPIIIKEQKNLTSIVLDVFSFFYEKDQLKSLFQFAKESTPTTGRFGEKLVQCDDGKGHKLVGLFLKGSIDSVRERNSRSNTIRWFEKVFIIDGNEYYLSTQWNANGNYQLTLSDLNSFLVECYKNEQKQSKYAVYIKDDKCFFIEADVDYMIPSEETTSKEKTGSLGEKNEIDDKHEPSDKIESEFKSYLLNVAKNSRTGEKLAPTSVPAYLSLIKCEKLFDYNPNKWNHIKSIYDITSIDKINDILKSLSEDKDFIDRNKNDTAYRYYRSSSLMKYRDFLNYRNAPFHEDDVEDSVDIKIFYAKQLIYFGAPGTGKSFKIEDPENGNGLKNVDESRKFRTTFHPDYDYAQFIGAYKPRKKDDDKDIITYDFVPQVFAKAYVAAWKQYFSADDALTAGDQVYLVIEEINRGNCAQIFGDIFQLLDRVNEGSAKGFSRYSIDADYDFAKYIEDELKADEKWDNYKSVVGEGKLKLPPNLNILATMNTSDQSLFPMDSAFKRRFDWEYIPINYKMPKADFKVGEGDLSFDWLHFLKKVNADIRSVTESEDKQMGEFFIKPKENENITLEEFRSKVLFYLWDTVYKDETDKKNLFHFPYPEKGPGITFQRLFEEDEAGKLSDNSKKIIRKMLETLDAAYDSEEYNDFKIFPAPAKPTEDK